MMNARLRCGIAHGAEEYVEIKACSDSPIEYALTVSLRFSVNCLQKKAREDGV